MGWLANLKISKKMILVAALAILALGGLGGYFTSQMSNVYNAANYGNINSVPSLQVLFQILRGGKNYYITILRHVQNTDESRMTELEQVLRNAQEMTTKGLSDYEKLVSDDTDKQMLTTDREMFAHLVRAVEEVLPLSRANKNDEARQMLREKAFPYQDKLAKALDEHMHYNMKLATEGAKNAEDGYISARRNGIITIVVTVAVLLSLVILISRYIIGPVNKATDLAEIMAAGDFTSQLNIHQTDEIGMMSRSLNKMSVQLAEMMREITSGVNDLTSSSNDMAAVSNQLSLAAKETADKSSTVAAAAEEMSANTQSISAAMEQSANNVNMVASSTEEMTATVNEIAQKAEKARTISEGAVKQSNYATEKMALLGESAQKIGRVTETISEISDQTNLLALNATIEAARAGDAGKGFAVVANEIKELARQTAEATVDIKNQIGEMQVTTTTTIEDIQKIAEVISEINNVISGIAAAVEEQAAASKEISENVAQASQGIAEVNENVAQSTVVIADITRDISGINQQAKQVGDGSSQVQLSAQGLSKLAAQLEILVKKFKV